MTWERGQHDVGKGAARATLGCKGPHLAVALGDPPLSVQPLSRCSPPTSHRCGMAVMMAAAGCCSGRRRGDASQAQAARGGGLCYPRLAIAQQI